MLDGSTIWLALTMIVRLASCDTIEATELTIGVSRYHLLLLQLSRTVKRRYVRDVQPARLRLRQLCDSRLRVLILEL